MACPSRSKRRSWPRDDVLVDRDVLDERLLLEDPRQAGAERSTVVGRREVGTVEAHRATVGAHDAAEDVEKRRLAGAVLADEAHHAPRRDVEGHVV
jgi:hypothetical protein